MSTPPDGPRHRRPTPAGRVLASSLTAGALVVTVAAGGWLRDRTPDVDRRERPFLRSGAVGTAVDVRTFEATLLDVRGGTKVSRNGSEHDTGGVWLVVRVRIVARAAPSSVGYAAVVDDRGLTYLATGRFVQGVAQGGRTLQPGIGVVAEIAFEVPVDAAVPLRLRLAGRALDQRMDAMAQVGLPVDAETLRRWRVEAQTLTIAPPEVAP